MFALKCWFWNLRLSSFQHKQGRAAFVIQHVSQDPTACPICVSEAFLDLVSGSGLGSARLCPGLLCVFLPPLCCFPSSFHFNTLWRYEYLSCWGRSVLALLGRPAGYRLPLGSLSHTVPTVVYSWGGGRGCPLVCFPVHRHSTERDQALAHAPTTNTRRYWAIRSSRQSAVVLSDRGHGVLWGSSQLCDCSGLLLSRGAVVASDTFSRTAF